MLSRAILNHEPLLTHDGPRSRTQRGLRASLPNFFFSSLILRALFLLSSYLCIRQANSLSVGKESSAIVLRLLERSL